MSKISGAAEAVEHGGGCGGSKIVWSTRKCQNPPPPSKSRVRQSGPVQRGVQRGDPPRPHDGDEMGPHQLLEVSSEAQLTKSLPAFLIPPYGQSGERVKKHFLQTLSKNRTKTVSKRYSVESSFSTERLRASVKWGGGGGWIIFFPCVKK